MAFEPINIFSHRIDPRGVAELMRRRFPDASIAGPDDDWSKIEVVTARVGLLRRKQTFALGHDSKYYDGENWPRQIMGMQGYFARFPDASNKLDVLQLIRSFRFSLAVPVEDLDIEADDQRLELLYEVCRHLDGAIFTPSALRDSAGRVLYDSDGYVDPAAILPALPPMEDHPDAEVEEPDEGEYDAIEPPTAERVARRVLAMTAVCARATLELDVLQENLKAKEGEKHRQRLIEWISSLDINEELEPQEWKVLQRPVGKLEEQDFINAMWRVEGLVVLAWALQLFEVPPYDELVVPFELYDAIGIFDVDAGNKLLAEAQLRTQAELQEMAEHLLACHWRVREFSLRPQAFDFVTFSKECWFGSFDISRFRVVNRDLAIGGVAIKDADPDHFSQVGSTAMERHQAINWLNGHYSTIYSEIDTPT